MKPILVFGLVIIPFLNFGQIQKLTDEQVNNSGMIKLIFAERVSQADSLAKVDISNGTPFILLQSGISPIVYSSDNEFENRYRVYFSESGCTGPKLKLAEAYNKVTFEHLTKVHGRKWTREIRRDVIGFKRWRRTGK